MENRLVWQDRFNIGVDVIDKEHRKLFKIINKLFAFGEDEEKSQWVCQEGIKYFKDHAVKHFADEEAYMESINYSGLQIHKRIHDDFREKTIPALQEELERSGYSEDAVSHFLGVCTGWLLGHTLIEDRAITGKAISQWEGLLPTDAHDAMRQAILQQLYDMFQLDAKVVSETYSGEKFGKGIYYRIIYGNDKGEKWENFLVFEETMLINTVGKLIGIKADKVTIMLINAVRYTAIQCVERIMEHFPSSSAYKVKSENLLTYEQFKKVFEREKPQFSMLFDTGAGYFAYCTIAPHLKESGVLASSIKAENAMSEIEKYLKKNEAAQKEMSKKKKILVVDDSNVILKAMEELLGQEYEMTFATSGLSAISSLTLERPDLILLDYEMPVCNGRQVLEMIRSEKDFAEIAVIFLTGRVDKESVKQVLSLKPAGYLSKNLKPEEIKKNIDKYFEQVKQVSAAK
ncbi:MAG: response regulator [Clostridium sp.]|nr:response regulator [Clostridium sp.]MCM1171485.1 response regulator [Clostridium sp.]